MKTPLYAALDLHSRYSVLGSMDYDGNTQPKVRFPTSALLLRKNIEALRQKKWPIYLTIEAGAFTRWASAIARPLVERLIICEPRHNRLINSNPTKSDEADVEGMCLLLRLGKLKEVWMGQDRTGEIYRALVYELSNWRDAQARTQSADQSTLSWLGRTASAWDQSFLGLNIVKSIWSNCRLKKKGQ